MTFSMGSRWIARPFCASGVLDRHTWALSETLVTDLVNTAA